MKNLKSFENFSSNSKAKEVGKINFPKFEGDKIYMLPFELSNPILPDKYKRWEGIVKEMVEMSPVKQGTAFLTVDEKEVKAGETHRRGGPHTDGNFIYGFQDGKVIEIDTTQYNEGASWGKSVDKKEVSWGKSVDKKKVSWGRSTEKKKDVSWGKSVDKKEVSWGRSEDSPVASSWATNFLVGGLNEEQHTRQYCSDKGGMIIASNYEACKGWLGEFKEIPLDGGDCSHMDLSNLETFILKPNKVYLGNSTFIHESLQINEDVKRQMIRITLPEEVVI